MIDIQLVKYRQVEAELLDLFRLSFGHDITPELWNWKHTGNYITSGDPEVIVAMDGDKMVGARPFIFIDVWLGNQKGIAAQHCDTMVHPEYQRQGLFNLMGQFSLQYLKENGCLLSYGYANLLSRSGFLKQGYRIIGTIEIMFRLLKPEKIISRKLKSKFLGSVAGLFYDKLLVKKPKKISGLSHPFQVYVADQFIEELRQVDTLRDEKAIDLARSERLLKWRYDGHPDYKYKYIAVTREGVLSGYAVISARKEGNRLTQGLIVDYLVKNNDTTCFQVLLDSCLIEFEKSECDYASVLMISKSNPIRELFTRSGFKSSFGFPYKIFFEHGYLDAIQIQEQMIENIDIYDQENWRLSYAFSDVR